MPVYPGALEISFAFEINNLAIRSAGNRTHGPYTIRGGYRQRYKEARKFTENPANSVKWAALIVRPNEVLVPHISV